MAKIRLMSDLHLEFGPLELKPAGEDVLVLAGDIGVAAKGGHWALATARSLGAPAVMIAGNHEFYHGEEPRGDMRSVYEDLHEIAAKSGGALTFLQNEAATVAGVRFVGATMWTDFNLFGDPIRAKANAAFGMNDYRMIVSGDDKLFSPEDAAAEHRKSVAFLADEFKAKPAEPLVVVTHHAPSKQSIAGHYARDEYSPAYASNLEPLVEASGATLWIHGHVHHSFDYTLGKTRVRTNPRGYYRREVNPEFNADLVVEAA